MTSIADVAAAAGVGIGTVSRVLNDSPHVSPETRAKVEAAIDELGYRPSPTARALSSGHSTAVCLVVPPFTNPGVSERLAAAADVLTRREFEVIVKVAETPADVTRIVSERSTIDRPAGLVFLDVPITTEDGQALLSAGVPTAVTGFHVASIASSWADPSEALRIATEHLVKLGHRRIALVQRPEPLGGEVPRRQGYLAVVGELMTQPRVETVIDPTDPGSRNRLGELLAPTGDVTGVVTTSDDLAYAVLAAAASAGRRVPEDLSVVGSGDLAASAHIGLTTVREDVGSSAAWAAEQVLGAIDGTLGDTAYRAVEVELIERGTSGPAPETSVS
ncbi:MAG: LacI family DNA-binding transcriptional regulator [Acidimicrobiia bacterium]